MLNFLLGISITLNALILVVALFYLKFKLNTDFFDGDEIDDEEIAREFLK